MVYIIYSHYEDIGYWDIVYSTLYPHIVLAGILVYIVDMYYSILYTYSLYTSTILRIEYYSVYRILIRILSTMSTHSQHYVQYRDNVYTILYMSMLYTSIVI